MPYLSWKDFTYHITVDEIGQWDISTRVKYYGGEEFIHNTSIMCEKIEPSKILSLDTMVSSSHKYRNNDGSTIKAYNIADLNPKGISFGRRSDEICILNEDQGYFYLIFSASYDTYIADVLGNRIITSESFDEILIDYGN